MGLIGKYFGIVGIVVVVLIVAIVKGLSGDKMKQVFAALRTSGVDAARAEVDKMFTPTRNPPLAARFAALALIGDRSTLAREVGAASGKLRNIAYQKAWGLLGLVLLDDPSARAALAEHVALCDRELPMMMGKIKQAIRGIGTIGAGDVDAIAKLTPGLFPFHTEWTRALTWECVARAFDRGGKPELAKNARQRLAELERAKAA